MGKKRYNIQHNVEEGIKPTSKITESQLRQLIREELQQEMAPEADRGKVKSLMVQLKQAEEQADRMSKWYSSRELSRISYELSRIVDDLKKLERRM